MNKKDLKLLEKVFISDIETGLPFQSKSKEYKRLEEEGYVQQCSVTLPGRFPVTITGYTLTILGNFTYCQSCKDEEE